MQRANTVGIWGYRPVPFPPPLYRLTLIEDTDTRVKLCLGLDLERLDPWYQFFIGLDGLFSQPASSRRHRKLSMILDTPDLLVAA
jgi:hypothetical protein